MKYYYNGKLVRTSKNEYKYGLYSEKSDRVIKCSNSIKPLENEIRLKKDNAYGFLGDIEFMKRNPDKYTNEEIELTIKETDDYFNGLKIIKLEKIE